MISYHIERPGVLVQRKHSIPEPGPHEVLVRIHACSLNYRDLLMLRGHYNAGPVKADLIPLSDGAGVVEAVGKSVSRVRVGDRVAGIFRQNWLTGAPPPVIFDADLGSALDGMLSEYRLLPEDGVVPIPPHLSFEQAATLPCAGVTAWSALVEPRGVNPGDTVLVQGTGGVSILALQLSVSLGCHVIATTSSDAKAERLRNLGAEGVINYAANTDWDQEVLRLTGGRGVDLTVEVAGGESFAKSCRCTRVGGHISLVGVLSNQPNANIAMLLLRQLSLSTVSIGSRAHFGALNDHLERHRIEPIVERVFAFNDASAAFELLAGRSHFAKIAIRVAP